MNTPFFRPTAAVALLAFTTACRAQPPQSATPAPQETPAPVPAATPQPLGKTAVVESAAPALDPAVQKQIDDFFTGIEKHEIGAAYDQLLKGTKIADRPADVEKLKSMTQQATQAFGDISGHEILSVKNVGTRLLSATCLSLGKNFPLRWRLYFYKSADTWRLIDIRVDDRLADMFGEPAAPAPDARPAAASRLPAQQP